MPLQVGVKAEVLNVNKTLQKLELTSLCVADYDGTQATGLRKSKEEAKSKMMKKLIIGVAAIMLMCYSYMPLASAFMLEPGQTNECEAMKLRVTNITGEKADLEVCNKGQAHKLEILPYDSVLWESANTPTHVDIKNIGKATVLIDGCDQK